MTDLAFDDREKYIFYSIKSVEHLKYFKNGNVLNLGLQLTTHAIKNQNPSCETVPLSWEFSVVKFVFLPTVFTVENHSISDRRVWNWKIIIHFYYKISRKHIW